MINVKIYSNFNLSIEDIRSLNLLYLPLIGDEAVTLYTFMHSLLDKSSLESNSIDKDNLINLLGWKLNKYNKVLSKLEGIGLVRSFVKEDEQLILLLTPFTPKNFLKDTILGSYLEAKIGSSEYLNIIKMFRIPDINLKEYKETTKTFGEVYNENIAISNNKVYDNLLGRRPNNRDLKSNADFDYDLYLSQIDKDKIRDLSDFKKKIDNFVYPFSLEQMVNLFNDSIDKTGYFDYDLLNKQAQKLYDFLYQNQDSHLSEDKEVELMDNMSVGDLLNTLMGNTYRNPELQKINDIYNNIDLPRGVLNVMIMDTYKKKQSIPTLSYFKKMATSWKNNGVYTTSEALKYTYKENVKITSTTSKGRRKTEKPLEDWEKEGMKQVMEVFKEDE